MSMIHNCGLGLLLGITIASTTKQCMAQDVTESSLVIAETNRPSKKQGMIKIGKITWKCSDRRCVATTRNVLTNVDTCQALAELVGPLALFGRSSKPMASYDLALCNVRAQVKLARLEREREKAAALGRGNKPAGTKPRTTPIKPPAASVASGDAAPAPQGINESAPRADKAIPPSVTTPSVATEGQDAQPKGKPVYGLRVTRLFVMGKGTLQEPVTAAPSAGPPAALIRVEKLSLVGRGRLQEEVHGDRLTVKVEKLELIGKDRMN
jgi:hypothetical protein